MKMWRAAGGLLVLLALSLTPPDPAAASEDEDESAEKVVAFQPVQAEKMALVRTLVSHSNAVREGVENGELSIARDVKYALVPLHDGSKPALLILNEGPGCCGTDGCRLEVWESDGKGWRKILGTLTQASPRNNVLRVQKATDHGYHRLVERRRMSKMSADGKEKIIMPQKPIHYMWNGETYDDDYDDEDRPPVSPN